MFVRSYVALLDSCEIWMPMPNKPDFIRAVLDHHTEWTKFTLPEDNRKEYRKFVYEVTNARQTSGPTVP